MKSILLKASVAMLAIATLAFSTQAGDDLTWSGDSGNYSAPANWTSDGDLTGYTSIFDWKTDAPGKNIRFGGAAAGKTVTMDIWDNRVWNCWFYNGTTPVTFAAADTTTGFEAYWGFHICAAANDVAALTVANGLYTTPSVENNASSWGTGDNATFTLNLAGGKIDLWGHKGTDGLYLTHGKGVASTINITGGTLAVANDIAIGNADTDDTSSTTISISNGGALSCGTATVSKWLKFPAAGTGKTTINLNAGGTLALWHIRHAGAGECELNFNGGTLKALGDIGYGLLGYDSTDASTMSIVLKENGGTIDTDFNTSLNNPVSGTGGLVKKGSGTLTFPVMPEFTGSITVAADAGSVILPSGATIAAGADTLTRTTSAGNVEYYYFSGSTYSSSTLFSADADATITLSGDAVLNVDDTKSIGKLTVTGSGVLSLDGSGTVTASSLQIDSGVTVQLVSATTLATGPLQTSLVTGSGTIVYDAVPDGTASDLKPDEAGYTASTWTGTVWIQNCIYRTATGSLWTDPAAYGNSGSKVKFTNARIYLKAGVDCDAEIVLSNIDSTGASKTFGLMLTDGNGGQINKFAKLSGDGTFSISGSGGAAEIISIRDIVDFAGVFNLPSRIVVIGDQDGTIAQQYVGFANTGAIVIPEGVSVSVPSDKTWVLGHGFVGAGTLKYTYPWQVGTSSLSNGDYWTGTVELASCVNTGTGSVAVYPDRMGNANSKIVFKGLAPGSSKGYFLSGSTSATIQLDGDVTISDGSSGTTYSLGVLTGIGSFTGATSLGTACTFAFSAVSNYTGTISANSKSLVTIGTYMSDADVAVGTKLVSVDSDNAYVTLNSVTVTGGEPQTVATAVQSGDDGYGVYVTAFQRDVYWVGGTSGNWSDTTAWALADGTPLNAYPSDYTQNAGDNVIFTNNAVVVADCRPVITKMTLNADVTLSTTDAFVANTYAGKKYLFVETVEGEGTLTLSNAVIAAIGSGRPFKIYTPVCVADGTRNSFGCSNFANYLYGDLSGSGYLEVRNSTYGGLYLYGDNSEFCGEFDSSETTRCTSAFYAGNATSSKAIWKLRGTDQDINRVAFITDSSTYYFGALLEGSLLQSVYNNPTLEVGARDEVASVADLRGRGVDSKNNKYYFNITKVGTNVFTVVNGNSTYKNNIGNVLIEGGTLALPGVPNYATYITFAGEGATLQPTAEGLDFSALIKNSTSAIIIDDSLGGSATWDTALDSSNKGGLVKDGYGTLTLTKVPQYSGATIVKDGKLVVPFGTALSTLEIRGNATVEVDMTDAAANAMAFSVGKIVGDKTKVSLVNNTSGVEFTLVETANGFVYVNGSKSYTWVGPTGDSNWSTAANWGQETDIPTSADTVTIPGSMEVYIDTAAAALAITANGDLTIIGPSNAKTTLAATSLVVDGNLTVSNNVELAIGAMNVSGKITMTQSNIDSDSYADNLGDANVGNMDIKNGFSGSGVLINNGTLELTGNESFIGSIGGGQSVTKKGEETYMLIGNNTFTGGLAIEKGTLMLGTPRDVDNVIYDFDASDRNNFTFSSEDADAYPTEWKSSVGDRVFKYSSTASATLPLITTAYFGGNSSLYLGSNSSYTQFYLDSAGYVPKTLFVVYREVEMTDYATLWGESSHNGYCIGRRNGSGNNFWVKRQNSKTDGQTWGLYQNGVATATAYVGSDQVFCAANADRCARTDKVQVLSVGNDTGRAFRGAYGEVIGYSDDINHAERKAIEAYLMAKWNVGSATYNVIPATADVTMNAGATLDMGGLTQTVKSFAGAGTVVNGSLKTTGSLKVTGALTIPAVKGQTYELGAANLTLTAGETGAIVKIPDGAKAVGRLIVPHGWTVGADAACDVVVTDLPKNWNVRPQRVGDDTDQWFIGPNAFVIHFR